ncbi:YtnP family quorum-quenching lactonase [Metabacillus arenae]|uniref:MBL fold metallo-hydrolase n=1 Tax=Metabacillus arenae TaxID=2771434 RepID=A0A926S0N0_9BACI|nr:MBL fold metallo-hydrolase [Metabacillus arenae]MBD1380179.1 MBL fold metallo-hydrolase [Metabacillus arenae]
MESITIGQTKLTWLKGGVTHLDGGAMFGVVPKPLWSKKYPVNENNQIELRTDPILIEKDGKYLLIETGIGEGKLTEKQRRNYGVTEESELEASLGKLGLTSDDIDYVLMTHLHFDHACGLTKHIDGEEYTSVFKHAKIITSNVEWEEMKHPTIRSRNTYWKENWEAAKNQVHPFENDIEVINGIKMIHTGGHSDGHCIVVIEEERETIIHMADLMPTHAHKNPLWVLAFDDYPMTSIEQKQKWLALAKEKQAWLTFYHDAIYRALKWNDEGEVIESVKREI